MRSAEAKNADYLASKRRLGQTTLSLGYSARGLHAAGARFCDLSTSMYFPVAEKNAGR